MPARFQTIPAASLKPPSEHERSFDTYLHYLQSLSGLCFFGQPTVAPHPEVVRLCASTDSFKRIARKSSADLHRVGRLLRNAWTTEVGLRLSREMGDGLVRFANHWAPVQTYYVTFLQAQAYFAASCKPPVSDHARTLQTLSEDLRSGRLSAPAPWSVLCTSEKDCGGDGFVGLPAEAVLESLSSQAIPDPTRYWSFYCLMLRTTRQRLLATRAAEWKRQNKRKDGQPRKQISAAARAKLDAGLHGTTLFDFLYRLRLRSNYRDADTLLEGTTGDRTAKVFNESLIHITDVTSLVLEAHTRRHIGADHFDRIAQEFLDLSPVLAKAPLAIRLRTLQSGQ